MSVIEYVLLGLVILFLLVAAVRLFSAPLKLALHVALNALLGFAALWLLNVTSDLTGLSMGLNVFNALTVGVLGAPGFLLLLLVKGVLA